MSERDAAILGYAVALALELSAAGLLKLNEEWLELLAEAARAVGMPGACGQDFARRYYELEGNTLLKSNCEKWKRLGFDEILFAAERLTTIFQPLPFSGISRFAKTATAETPWKHILDVAIDHEIRSGIPWEVTAEGGGGR